MSSIFSALRRIMFLAGVFAGGAIVSQAAAMPGADDYLNDTLSDSWRVYSPTAQTDELSDARWWQRFDDPLLDSLIEVGLANNYNVAMATRRIEIARAALGQARGAYMPTINASAGYDYARSSGVIADHNGRASRNGYCYGTVSMSWELDVFGKISSQVKARKAQVLVSRAERAGVKVSLEAQIATAYVELRVKQAQMQVAREHAESQLHSLKLAEARFEAGISSMLDVDQARTVYYSTVAMIPMLRNDIHDDINAIGVLLGENPDLLAPRLKIPQPMPGYIQLVAAGLPSDLLRRRPDVVQAEDQIKLEAENLGIARKDYLPTLTLNGSIGTSAHRPGDLFTGQSFTYSIAPALTWTVFDGLSRRYNVAAAREQMQVAIDNYNLTVITAFQETDNALSGYFANLRYIECLNDLVSASRDYDRRSLENYKSGLSSYINVANAQVSYLENQNTLIATQGQALVSLINLYKALGGGWSDTELR